MNFPVLLGKELREQWRTYRFLVVAVVFVAFAGLLSPITAKLAPELLKSLTSSAGQTSQPISIQLPEPTAADAIAQFLKNLTQIGVIALILVAMGTVALERERGTAATVLSKPVSRLSFLLAKFAALTLTFAISLALAALACWYYTVVLFGSLDAGLFLRLSLLAALYLWVWLAVTFLCSALFKSQIAAGGLAFGLYVASSLLGIVPRLKDYLPGALIEGAGRLSAGAPADVGRAVVVSLLLVALCLLAAWRIFEGHEL